MGCFLFISLQSLDSFRLALRISRLNEYQYSVCRVQGSEFRIRSESELSFINQDKHKRQNNQYEIESNDPFPSNYDIILSSYRIILTNFTSMLNKQPSFKCLGLYQQLQVEVFKDVEHFAEPLQLKTSQ